MMRSVPGLLYATHLVRRPGRVPARAGRSVVAAASLGALLGLVPTVLAFAGLVRIVRRPDCAPTRPPRCSSPRCSSRPFSSQTWVVPRYSAVKASYLLPALVPVSLALGIGVASRRGVPRAALRGCSARDRRATRPSSPGTAGGHDAHSLACSRDRLLLACGAAPRTRPSRRRRLLRVSRPRSDPHAAAHHRRSTTPRLGVTTAPSVRAARREAPASRRGAPQPIAPGGVARASRIAPTSTISQRDLARGRVTRATATSRRSPSRSRPRAPAVRAAFPARARRPGAEWRIDAVEQSGVDAATRWLPSSRIPPRARGARSSTPIDTSRVALIAAPGLRPTASSDIPTGSPSFSSKRSHGTSRSFSTRLDARHGAAAQHHRVEPPARDAERVHRRRRLDREARLRELLLDLGALVAAVVVDRAIDLP